MNDNVSDKEQIEMLKKWWTNYGRSILIAVIVGLLLGYGWNYYRNYQATTREQASLIYQQLLIADSKGDAKSSAQLVTQLTTDYARTPYASFAQLVLAKQAVNDHELTKAQAALTWVMDSSNAAAFKEVARLRSARILLSQKKYTDALTLIATLDDKSYESMSLQLKGDILLAQNKQQEALTAYQKASKLMDGVGFSDPVLAVKISSVGAKDADAK